MIKNFPELKMTASHISKKHYKGQEVEIKKKKVSRHIIVILLQTKGVKKYFKSRIKKKFKIY